MRNRRSADQQRDGDPPGTQDAARDSDRDAYRRAFRAYTPAAWEMVESGQGDLLRLLVGRVEAPLGVGVVFGLSVLFGGHPKGDDAGRAMLATMLHDLAPERAHTLIVTLADAWRTAERRSFDTRAGAIQAAVRQAVRRLRATDLPPAEDNALEFIAGLLEEITPGSS